MAKYRKFQMKETIHSIVKINDDGSVLHVSFYSGIPAIDIHNEVLSLWSEDVDATKEEFINFYNKINNMIINHIIS